MQKDFDIYDLINKINNKVDSITMNYVVATQNRELRFRYEEMAHEIKNDIERVIISNINL